MTHRREKIFINSKWSELSNNMERINKSLPNSFITLGVVFLIIGFIQQEFSINFESGFFTLGLFFVVGGLAALFLNKRNKNQEY